MWACCGQKTRIDTILAECPIGRGCCRAPGCGSIRQITHALHLKQTGYALLPSLTLYLLSRIPRRASQSKHSAKSQRSLRLMRGAFSPLEASSLYMAGIAQAKPACTRSTLMSKLRYNVLFV